LFEGHCFKSDFSDWPLFNAGNYLLSRARVGRTLLSAAFDLGVVLEPFIRQPLKINGKVKIKTNINGSGQECPLYTLTGLIECLSVTDIAAACRTTRRLAEQCL
jgi:hypothetical protein